MFAIGALAIVMSIVGLIVSGLFIANPSDTWHVFEAWKFKDPRANEPSEIFLTLSGVGGVVTSIALLIFGIVVISDASEFDSSKNDQTTSRAIPTASLEEQPSDLTSVGVLGYWNPVQGSLRVAAPVRTNTPGCVPQITVREFLNAVVISGEIQRYISDYCLSMPADAVNITSHVLRAPLGTRPVYAVGPIPAPVSGVVAGDSVVGDGSTENVVPTDQPLRLTVIDSLWVPLKPLNGPAPQSTGRFHLPVGSGG